MRRIAALLLTPLLLLPAACGGDGDGGAVGGDPPVGSAVPSAPAASGSGSTGGSPNSLLPVLSEGAAFGQEPTIETNGPPPKELQFKVLKPGTGKVVKSGDILVADFKGQVWDHSGIELTPFENSFETSPMVRPIGTGGIIPAWDQKVPGQRVGARLVLVAPPGEALGMTGNEQAGILPNDTLIFVIDILDTLDPKAGAVGTAVTPPKGLPTVTGATNPKITVPGGQAPKDLVSQVLIQGKGAKLKKDQLVAVHYTGVLWRGGKQFDSSWPRNAPLSFTLGQAGIIEGWNKGLTGKTIGSRVLLIVPPADGYGAEGNSAAGIRGTDTLVFVVDIVGAYATSAARE